MIFGAAGNETAGTVCRNYERETEHVLAVYPQDRSVEAFAFRQTEFHGQKIFLTYQSIVGFGARPLAAAPDNCLHDPRHSAASNMERYRFYSYGDASLLLP